MVTSTKTMDEGGTRESVSKRMAYALILMEKASEAGREPDARIADCAAAVKISVQAVDELCDRVEHLESLLREKDK